MSQYPREIAALLRGSEFALLTALALCTLSAILDIVCMALLPIFLSATLANTQPSALNIPIGSTLSSFLPTYQALVLAVISVFVLRGVLSVYVNAQLSRFGESIRAKLTHRLSHFYLTCTYQEFTERSVAWVLTVVGSYVNTFANSVALPLLRGLLDAMTMLAILGYLLLLGFQIVTVTGAVLVTVGLMYFYAIRKASAQQSRRLSEYHASFNHQISRALHSPREVRVFQLQANFLASMDAVLAKAADAQTSLVAIGSLPRVLGELMLIGLALAYMAYRTHTGVEPGTLISQLGVFGFVGLRLLPTFAQGLSNLATIRTGRHVTSLLAKELKLTQTTFPVESVRTEHASPVSLEPFRTLELRGVAFAYGSGPKVLDGVCLTVQRGDSIGIIGGSGAGKSTLGDLILGLLDPSAGEIFVNGQPLQLTGKTWWQKVGFVPQAVFLSNDTLLNNIAFGVPENAIDRVKARDAASKAQLEEVIERLENGLDTVIGDYGVRLSGGQRQRVAIARALYHGREFLILDEATSALDTETEEAVVRAVGALKGSITILIIAHRHSTLEGCDLIGEIKNGRLTLQRKRAISISIHP